MRSLFSHLSVSAVDGALEAQRSLARQRVDKVLEGDGSQAKLAMLQGRDQKMMIRNRKEEG